MRPLTPTNWTSGGNELCLVLGDEARTNSTMSRNSPEYCSIVKATGKLTRVLKSNITPICVDLVSNHLITPDQQRKLRNPHHDALDRAADLVELLTDKVEENPANYHTLIKILGEDRTMYGDVLECLALPSDSTPDPRAGIVAVATTSGIHTNLISSIYSSVIATFPPSFHPQWP